MATAKSLRTVPDSHVYIVERFGSFKSEWQAGKHILIPFIDRIAGDVPLEEMTADFEPQSFLTKDNSAVRVETSLSYRITDAKKYVYGVENPLKSVENLSALTLKSIIGEIGLDELLDSVVSTGKKVTLILDGAVDIWGIKVNSLEIKSIVPVK